MMPRQNCPVCGNRPRAYVERSLRNSVTALELRIVKLKTVLRAIKDAAKGVDQAALADEALKADALDRFGASPPPTPATPREP